jgi:hypothetical protein
LRVTWWVLQEPADQKGQEAAVSCRAGGDRRRFGGSGLAGSDTPISQSSRTGSLPRPSAGV